MIESFFRTLFLYFLFSSLPIAWFVFVEKKNLKGAVAALGLKRIERKECLNSIFLSLVYALLLTIVIEIVIVLLAFVGIADVENITQTVVSLPSYILILAITLAPISEEIMFRGFLRLKLGIVMASLVFLPFHSAYGSIVQYVGVFVVSIAFCLIYDRHDNLNVVILTHIIYNTIALARMGVL